MTSQNSLKTHTRVRRGNLQDHAAVRERILAAAFRLYESPEGLDALSMRSLAAELGLSAMGLYRYYANKAAVLQAMWEVVLDDAMELSQASSDAAAGLGPREKLCAGIDAFMRYWEQRPHHFSLVFMNEESLRPSQGHTVADDARLRAAVQHGGEVMDEFIAAVGGDPTRAPQARDLRMALMVGYLHSRLVNRRIAWSDFEALRNNATRSIMFGIEACVRGGSIASCSVTCADH